MYDKAIKILLDKINDPEKINLYPRFYKTLAKCDITLPLVYLVDFRYVLMNTFQSAQDIILLVRRIGCFKNSAQMFQYTENAFNIFPNSFELLMPCDEINLEIMTRSTHGRNLSMIFRSSNFS